MKSTKKPTNCSAAVVLRTLNVRAANAVRVRSALSNLYLLRCISAARKRLTR